MTEFSIPNIFSAGTKAKAYEVNENFEAIKTTINNQATLINANTTSVSELGEYVDGELREGFIDLINSNKTKFAVNSAYYPLLAINPTDSSQLDFNIDDGTTFAPLVASPVNGDSFTRTSVSSLDMSSFADGTFNIFVGAEGNPYAYSNTIYAQKEIPLSPSLNDIWVDTSCEPLNVYRYDSSEEDWGLFGDIPVGKVTVASSLITAVEQPKFNENGAPANKSAISKLSMPSSTSDTLVIGATNTSYTAPANGWFYFAPVSTTSTDYLYGLKNTTAALMSLVRMAKTNVMIATFVPASKGDVVKIHYEGAINTGGSSLKFIYAEGEV